MSIDPQEWSDKRMEAGSDVEATQVHIDLIRAVIADEAAKAKPIIREVVSPPFAFEDDEQPVAAGDEPDVKGCISLEEAQESGCCRICGWSTRGPHGPENAVTLNYGKEFAHTRCLNSNNWIAAELSRRVAEVSADRDKWIERVGEHAAAMKVIAIERDSLRQQLAASQAEVERLTEFKSLVTRKLDGFAVPVCRDIAARLEWLFSEFNARTTRGNDLQTEVERLKDQLDCKQAFWDAEIEISKTVTKERDEYFAEIVKLRSEVSRLSRPVEGVPDNERFKAIGTAIAKTGDYIHERHVQSERNARESSEKRAEAAEAERDELREAWAMFTVGETVNGSHKAYALAKPSDERNNVALAAFRAEKAKVGA